MLSLVQNVQNSVAKLVVANCYSRTASALKMSLRISKASFGMVFEETVRRTAFQKLHDFFVSHAFRQGDKWMYMVRHNSYEMDFDFVPWRCFANASLTKVFVLKLGKHFITVLCLPIYVPEIHSDLMVIMFQFNVYKFNFRCLRTTKIFIAHATQGMKNLSVRAEISLRTLFIIEMVEKSYGGSKAIPSHT